MKLILRTLLTLTFLQLGLKSFSQQQITGRVIDELTKKPIKEAKVAIEGKDISTQTNHLGFFQLTVDSVDLITVSNNDYESLTFSTPKINTFQIELKKAQISIYKGGMKYFYSFIAQNIKYPYNARTSNKQGYVYISFKIDSLGKLNNLDLITDIGGGCGKEALRVISKIPSDYIPDPTNSLYILPIRFRIGNNEDNKPDTVVQLPIGKKLNEVVVTAMGI